MNTQKLKQVHWMLSTLTNKGHVRAMRVLYDHPEGITQLQFMFHHTRKYPDRECTQSETSRKLNNLIKYGVVEREERGGRFIYRPCAEGILRINHWVKTLA